jgi:predicted small secreted protein
MLLLLLMLLLLGSHRLVRCRNAIAGIGGDVWDEMLFVRSTLAVVPNSFTTPRSDHVTFAKATITALWGLCFFTVNLICNVPVLYTVQYARPFQLTRLTDLKFSSKS